MLIEGTVTDQTPASKDTSAIADEDIQAWMEYKWADQAKPIDAKGVTVHLTAMDPNGNMQEIGDVVTDLYGSFAKLWTPPVPGLYKVIATFDGTKSYWGSSAQTAFGVSKAAAVTAPPLVTPSPPPTTAAPPTEVPSESPSASPTSAIPPKEAAPTTTYIAIGIAVIIVIAAAAALLLRKRQTT